MEFCFYFSQLIFIFTIKTLFLYFNLIFFIQISVQIEKSFENYCEDKIFECYQAIREFNNYNYEK